jgi:hypothetical protein
MDASLTPQDLEILSKISDPRIRRATARGMAEQHKFKAEPLYKLTGQGHYESDFVKEMAELKAKTKSK